MMMERMYLTSKVGISIPFGCYFIIFLSCLLVFFRDSMNNFFRIVLGTKTSWKVKLDLLEALSERRECKA